MNGYNSFSETEGFISRPLFSKISHEISESKKLEQEFQSLESNELIREKETLLSRLRELKEENAKLLLLLRSDESPQENVIQELEHAREKLNEMAERLFRLEAQRNKKFDQNRLSQTHDPSSFFTPKSSKEFTSPSPQQKAQLEARLNYLEQENERLQEKLREFTTPTNVQFSIGSFFFFPFLFFFFFFSLISIISFF